MGFKDYFFSDKLLLEANPEKRIEFLYNRYAKKIQDYWERTLYNKHNMNPHSNITQKTSDMVEALTLKKIHELISDIVLRVDPTEGIYSDWIIKNYMKQPFEYVLRWKEDSYKVTEDLEKYHKYKKYFKKLSDEEQDSTVARYGDINNIVSFNGLWYMTGKLGKYIKQEEDKEKYTRAAKEVEKVYNTEKWLILIPKTQEASCLYGKGTRWCTAADSSYNAFESYNRDGPLYIIIEKATQDKWQFHFQTEQYMDVNDNQINVRKFFDEYPELRDIMGDLALANNAKHFFALCNPQKFADKIISEIREQGEILVPDKKYINGNMDLALRVGKELPELFNRDIKNVLYFAPEGKIHFMVDDWVDMAIFVGIERRGRAGRTYIAHIEKILDGQNDGDLETGYSYSNDFWDWLNKDSIELVQQYCKNHYTEEYGGETKISDLSEFLDDREDDTINDLLTRCFNDVATSQLESDYYEATIEPITNIFGEDYKWIDGKLHFTNNDEKKIRAMINEIESYETEIASLHYFYNEYHAYLDSEDRLEKPDYERAVNMSYPEKSEQQDYFNERFANEIDVGETPETRKEKELMKQGQQELDLNSFKAVMRAKIGKHNSVPDSKFNKHELKSGIDIEGEHTDKKKIAKLIAKDHLSEIPDYYKRLKKMEKTAKKDLKESSEDFKGFFAVKEQTTPKFNTYYHVTPSENTPLILRDGLIIEAGNDNGIYLLLDKKSANDTFLKKAGDTFDEAQEMDLLKIMLPVEFPLDRDPESYEAISRVNIPKEYIYLLEKNI